MIPLMRKSRWTACIVAIGGIMLAQPCASSDRIDQETSRCDAPNGQSGGKVFPISNADTNISGRIYLHTADVGAEWASLGKILVHQRGARYGDGDCGCNGIAFYAFKNPDHVDFYMTSNNTEVPMGQGAYNTPIDFRISITPEGVMTVALGKFNTVMKTMKLSHPEHNTLEMTCSGADVSFLNIAVL